MLKNFLRGALLAFFATFLGVFLFFTFPDLVVGNLLRRPMPFWFYENEVRTCMLLLHAMCETDELSGRSIGTCNSALRLCGSCSLC